MIIDVSQTQTTHMKVNVKEEDILKSAIQIIGYKYGVSGRYLRQEGGKTVVKEDEQNWRHGSIGEDFVRVASPEDVEAIGVVNFLDKLQRSL